MRCATCKDVRRRGRDHDLVKIPGIEAEPRGNVAVSRLICGCRRGVEIQGGGGGGGGGWYGGRRIGRVDEWMSE